MHIPSSGEHIPKVKRTAIWYMISTTSTLKLIICCGHSAKLSPFSSGDDDDDDSNGGNLLCGVVAFSRSIIGLSTLLLEQKSNAESRCFSPSVSRKYSGQSMPGLLIFMKFGKEE